MFLNNLMLLFFWWVLFAKIDSLNGWGLEQILLLYAVTSRAYACQALLFGGSFTLSSSIAEGRLDFYHPAAAGTAPCACFSVFSCGMGKSGLFIIDFYADSISFCGQASGFIILIAAGMVMTSFAVIVHSLGFGLDMVRSSRIS